MESARRKYVVAGAGSLAVVLATGWLAASRPELLADPDVVLIGGRLPGAVTGGLLIGTGLLGVLAALIATSIATSIAGADPGRRTDRFAMLVAAWSIVVFGVLAQSTAGIALAGYLMALALPAALVVLVVQLLRRYPRGRVPLLLVVAGLIGAGVVSGVLSGPPLARLAAAMAGGLAAAGPRLLLALTVTAAAGGWLVVLWSSLRREPAWGRSAAWVARHRTPITVVAALGPVPYALARLTWLTPWPQFSPVAAALSPETRLWGLLLGGAALLGSVLTIGLIRPWGERFPRWMPGLAGREVPVAVAAVPGGVVATVLCVSAIPMIALSFAASADGLGLTDFWSRLLMVLVLPLWLWGPMLALAVWGYVEHRAQRRGASPAAPVEWSGRRSARRSTRRSVGRVAPGREVA
jgi:hypothetical protein